MTTTTILTIILGIISIIFAFVLGRNSVKKAKKTRKIKKAKKAKKTVKAKKERKPRKSKKEFVADPEALAGLEDEYKQATQNNELVPVTKTVKA